MSKLRDVYSVLKWTLVGGFFVASRPVVLGILLIEFWNKTLKLLTTVPILATKFYVGMFEIMEPIVGLNFHTFLFFCVLVAPFIIGSRVIDELIDTFYEENKEEVDYADDGTRGEDGLRVLPRS